jgi:hypothetical protein
VQTDPISNSLSLEVQEKILMVLSDPLERKKRFVGEVCLFLTFIFHLEESKSCQGSFEAKNRKCQGLNDFFPYSHSL